MIHIQEMFAAGLPSRTIVGLLPCMRDTDGGPAPHATTRLVDELTAERNRIDRTIRELTGSRDVLDAVIDGVVEAARPD